MKKLSLSVLLCVLFIGMSVGFGTKACALGSAPVAENLNINTYRNTSVNGILSAYDPEDDVVSYIITTNPVKGEIHVEANGEFIYTPKEGKKGRDYFGYKAIDSEGNYSQEATVIIKIISSKTIEYKDMENRAGEYAAVTLNKEQIFTGENLGSFFYFGPDKSVSNSEFVAMCGLALEDSTVLEEYMSEPESTITKAQAALMLNEAMKLNDVDYFKIELDAEEPVVQACMNLGAAGVMTLTCDTEDLLTREDAAIMLVKALEIVRNR